MPTTTAEATVLSDEPITTDRPDVVVPTVPADTATTMLATTTVPTVRTPVAPSVLPSTETPVDRLTRRALGALRRQGGRVLVTGRTDVPAVVARRLAQRNPALAARATCEDIFALAQGVLDERQIDVCIDQPLVDAAWTAAWQRVGRCTALHGLGEAARWRAEILGAIKGRGLVRFSQYADSAPRLASAVWDLYVAYSEELSVRFAHDRSDLIAIALDELTVNPSRSRFSVVVLDPTLPLSPTMVRLLRALTITR